MKEHLWCAPEIIRGPYQQRGSLHFILRKQREVQDNMVRVIMQPTADHKRYDDSHKWMTSVLGDKVRKMPRMFQQNSNFFLSSQPSTIQALYYHLLFYCLYAILCSPFSWKFVSRIHHKQLKSIGLETSSRAEFLDAELTTPREIKYQCMNGQFVSRNASALCFFSILGYIVLYSLLWKLYFLQPIIYL